MKSAARTNHRETWLVGGTIVTQDAKRRVLKSNLRIVDGRIESITTKTPPRSKSKNVKIIDVTGLTLVPGFVQAHVHLCQTLFRNQADDMELLDWLSKRIWVMEGAHSSETLYTSAKMGIHELLSSGTTCILDMGTVRHTESILKAAQELGIRGSFGKCLMDHPKTTPVYLRESTRAALAEAEKIYLKWNGAENDRIRISYAPRFVISCTETLLQGVTEIAREQKAVIHTHASENLKEIQMVKELVNCENVEYLNQLGMTSERLVLAHCVWLKPNEKDILKRTGTHVVHCPSSNMKLASGFAHVPDLKKRGINVALGADGAPCNNNLNMFQEMRLAAILHKPGYGPKTLPAQVVLDMATRDGAKALGWDKDIGSLEVGKKADIAVLDLNQPENLAPDLTHMGGIDSDAIASAIVYSTQPQHVKMTLVDGKVVFSQGKVHGLSTEKLVAEIREAQAKIRKSVKLK